ncbi:barwin-like endoglucanase [Auriculariales sp. MPI-PUGE-AT-0066]|nr:barwin-like endoglucanase [Auriculariales sp. MPI-PUGE-AT-0066]
MRSLSSSFIALALAFSLAQANPLRVKRQGDHNAMQTGEMTFYNTGMTACGVTKSDTELVAAVSQLFFDTYPGATGNPNANPVCGQQATITNPATGKSVTVGIFDRCVSCAFGDIDITPAAFNQIADPNDGR